MSDRTNKTAGPARSHAPARSDLRDANLLRFLAILVSVVAGLGVLVARVGFPALITIALSEAILAFCILIFLTRGRP